MDLAVGVNYGTATVDGGHFRNDGGRRNGLTRDAALLDPGAPRSVFAGVTMTF